MRPGDETDVSFQLSDSLGANPSRTAQLLGVVRNRIAGVLGILVVLAVVALPNPLPDVPPGAYAIVGITEGIGLAVAAENLLWRPARSFDFERASRKVGGVIAAGALFVVAMSALGVELSGRDRALLAGFCLAGPVAIAGIDYLKAQVQAELHSSV